MKIFFLPKQSRFFANEIFALLLKLTFSSIILLSFRQRIILPSQPQNEAQKHNRGRLKVNIDPNLYEDPTFYYSPSPLPSLLRVLGK